MSDEGASAKELVIYACRGGHEDTLRGILPTIGSPKDIADVLNFATDGLGQHCLHLAAANGHEHILDLLLDQAGLEVDPIEPLENDTPLHKAVRHINGCPKEEWRTVEKVQLVEYLIDAGADTRMRNKAKLKPVELVDPRNKELRARLQKEEFSKMIGSDIVDTQVEAEEAANGSASGSDKE